MNRIYMNKTFMIKDRLFAVLLVWSLALFAGQGAQSQETTTPATATTAKVSVYFSPRGGAQAAIIREIDAAKESIRIQAYSYTSEPISQALLRAHQRGIKIKALLDDSNQTARYTGATFLQNSGIPVTIDSQHAIAHSKIIIVDAGTPGATVITGSFNFSKAAEENNTENLLVIKEAPELVKAYEANFETHLAHSAPYQRKNTIASTATGTAAGDEGEANPTTTTAPVTTTPATTTVTPPTPTPSTPNPTTPAAGGKININTATAKELEKLPGIGKTIAERIVEYRQANGPFKSVEDLNKVKGIGKTTLDKLRPIVTVQ